MEKSGSKKQKKNRITFLTVACVFFGLTIIGTLLLLLPFATMEGKSTSLMTAFFTALTSSCVTGNTIVDTSTHWTPFGKLVILVLTQLGGMGVISMVVFMVAVAKRQFSMSQIFMLQDMFTMYSSERVLKFFVRVFLGAMVIELLGAFAYMPSFISRFGVARGIWYSVFTSVSAFCNSGLSVIHMDSLEPFNDDPAVLIVTMILVVIGGLGFVVWTDIGDMFRRKERRRAPLMKRVRRSLTGLKTHTKMVIRMSVFLILAGAGLTLLLEWNNPATLGSMHFGQKLLNSFFQSVTCRSAGFSAISQTGLKDASRFIDCIFMFIGGSPVGTAGGVKTVTIFVILLNVRTFMQNKREVVYRGRRIPDTIIRKAIAIVTVQLTVSIVLCILLMVVSNVSMADAFYEMFSVVSTAGLTCGVTASVDTAGLCIVMIGMFVGRIGPIMMLLFFQTPSPGRNDVRHAEGKYIVG